MAGGPVRGCFLLWLVAAGIAGSTAFSGTDDVSPDHYQEVQGRVSAMLVADGYSSAYRVDLGLALAGTDSVELNGRLLRPEEYDLDLERGVLLLASRPARWSVIRVSCTALLPRAPRGYRRRGPPGMDAEMVPATRPVIAAEDSTSALGELDISGSKIIGVSIGGSEGTGLNQATRLAVRGMVEGVRVDAELSDQSSPIPPEGITLELEELDVVRIDLSGRGWRGGFGDVDFQLPTAGFGTLERRVVGGLVSGEYGPVEGRIGYARPRGRYGRSLLNGLDGVQGPYVLAPDGRETRLVTGSEEVYLDGRRMTRGWDADYTVDYSTGEIVFTSKHAIDRFTRIEASYQYVLDAWERVNAITGIAFESGPLRVSADYFAESDEPERDGRYELSPEEREYLAGIGGDTSRAWLDGGTRVGDSAGSYVVANDHYRYVGEGRGDYRVRFSFVGDSLGDYFYDDSLLAHVYAGPGAGGYVAKYRVELPRRTELGRLELNLGSGELRAGLTGIGRRNALNLLAGQPDMGTDGALGAWAGWSGDRFNLHYRGRLLALGFEHPGGDSLVDVEYDWGGLSQERVHHISELSGSLEPSDWLDVGADLGLLETRDDRMWARYVGRVRAGPVVMAGGRYGAETRASAEARPEFGYLRPRVVWSQNWPELAVRRSYEVGLGLAAGAGLDLDLGYRWLRADTADTVGGARVHETGGLAELELSWQSGDRFRTSGRVARQDRRYPGDAAGNWGSWLTGLNLMFSPRTGVRFHGDVQQFRRLVQLRDEYYRYVGPEEGHYSRDTLTGRYYFDPGGEYERVLAGTGSYVPASEMAFNVVGDWSAWRPVGLTGSLSRTDVSDSAPVRQSHSHSVRATVRLLEPLLTLWLISAGGTTSDRTLVVSGLATRRQRYRVELFSSRLPEVELRLRGERGLDERQGTGNRAEHSERLWTAVAEPTIGARLRLEIELSVEQSLISQPLFYPELGEFSLTSLSAGIGRNFALGTRWRLRGRAALTRRTSPVMELPFEIALARPLGWTPSAMVDLSHVLSETITLGGRYSFSDRPDRPAEHTVSAELRAYF